MSYRGPASLTKPDGSDRIVDADLRIEREGGLRQWNETVDADEATLWDALTRPGR